MAKRKRRTFTTEFKAQTVRLVRESGKSVGAVARELDLAETALRRWVQQAEWRQIALPSRNVYRMCGPQRAGVAVRHGSAFPQWSETNLCTRLTSSTSRPGRDTGTTP
jgi:transposase-like protein